MTDQGRAGRNRALTHGLTIIALTATLGLSACAGSASAPSFNPRARALKPCPEAPHCVSSQARDKDYRVAPLVYHGDSQQAHRRIIRVLKAMPRSTLVTVTPTFIHATFESAVFGFVDDVTVRLDTANHRLQIRSASRVGYYDFGVNGRRVARIRRAFEQVHNAERR